MNYITKIHEVKVAQDNPDVVAFVSWSITFSEGDSESIAGIHTILPTPEGEITPFAEITKEQLIEWVMAEQGGLPFVEHLYNEYHKTELDIKNKLASMTEVSAPYIEPIVVE